MMTHEEILELFQKIFFIEDDCIREWYPYGENAVNVSWSMTGEHEANAIVRCTDGVLTIQTEEDI